MSKALGYFCSFIMITLAYGDFAYAHGGGLDSNGGHYNRKTGIYHCHRSYCGSQKSNFTLKRNYSSFGSGLNYTQRTRPSDKVKTAQTVLQALGYYKGRIDGLNGSATTAAVREFSKDYQLSASIIDDRLILSLTQALSNQSRS